MFRLLLVASLFFAFVWTQGDDIPASSTYGSEFHIGFMRNFMGPITDLQLIIGTPENITVRFVVENSTGIIANELVLPGSPTVVSIPSYYQVLSSDYSERFKGIKVSSSDGNLLYVIAESSAFFLNYGTYIAYPSVPLTENVEQYEYGVVSADDPSDLLSSQVLLVGCSDNTVISVSPSVPISLPTDTQDDSIAYNIGANDMRSGIALHKMQTLLLSSLDDLTGTVIVSDQPLVVISGHECASIPSEVPGCEPLAVQVPPVATWGTEFLLAPFAGRNTPQLYKAVASQRNTSISIACGSQLRDVQRIPEIIGIFFQAISYCHIRSTSPIFLTSASVGGGLDERGDPAASIVSPVDQYVKAIDFVSLPRNDFPSSFISITVTPENYSPENILLDGLPVNCSWQIITDIESNIVGYGCSQTLSTSPYTPTKHSVAHSAANGSLSVIVYGFNPFPALGYAYLTGQVLRITNRTSSDFSDLVIEEDNNTLPFLNLTAFRGVQQLSNTRPDSVSEPISIPGGLLFGDEVPTTAYVSENGVISFNIPWRFSIPHVFPTPSYYTRQHMVIAPFWSDNDIRREGAVRYATFDAASDEQGRNWLQRVNQYVQTAQENDFEGTWGLTAHWDTVHPSPHGENDHRGISEEELAKTNNYQVTLVTNRSDTYIISSYLCGGIQWSSLGVSNAAVVGYNSRGNYYSNHPFSGLSQISDALSCTFNSRQKRLSTSSDSSNNVVYQVQGSSSLQSRMRRCNAFVKSDKFVLNYSGKTSMIIANRLPPCPHTIQQAQRDCARFVRLNDRPGDPRANQNCYVSANPINFELGLAIRPINLTQMCCYDHRSLITDPTSGRAGSFLHYHPIRDEMRYTRGELEFYKACCPGTDCSMYYGQRLVNDGSGYVEPTLGTGEGDPHYLTFDNFVHHFQGNGDYVLLRILPENMDLQISNFSLQGRMTPLGNPTRGVSVHRHLAFGMPDLAFEFVMGFTIYQTLPSTDQPPITLTIGETWHDPDVRMKLVRTSARDLIAAFFEVGVQLYLYAGSSHVNFRITVPTMYGGRTQGLLGNFDGDSTNEFHTRTSLDPLPINIPSGKQSPEEHQMVLDHFNTHWRLRSSDDSFFRFPFPNRRRRQTDDEFVPFFFNESAVTDEERMMCQGNFQCLFDLTATGDVQLAVDTLNHEMETDVIQNELSNFPPNISVDSTIFSVSSEQESVLTIVVEDSEDTFVLSVVDGLPGNSELEEVGDGVYEFHWRLEEATTRSLTFVANDSRGAYSTYVAMVELCACVNGGNCTRQGILSTNTTILLNCVCPEAYSGRLCQEDRNGCSEIECFEGVECMDIPAPGVGAMCGACPDGYTGDANKCYDINECELNATLCDQICENTGGSYICACSVGFELVDNTCQDINECNGIHECQQLCVNTAGSYTCNCTEGFTLHNDGRNCTANVPCDGSCSHECAVINGVEQCYCPIGFELSMPGGTQCIDINECSQSPCDQLCTNTEGSFECSCPVGFRLQSSERCEDINECLEAVLSSVDLCEDKDNSVCSNSEGSYSCTCVPGYQAVNSTTCSRIMNETPPPPPLVLTPTIGAENSVNYSASLLTPQTFTPALQQRFREVTSRLVSSFCAQDACDTIRSDKVIVSVTNLTIETVNVAIPISSIHLNDQGHLMLTVYIQLSDSFLSRENLQLAILQGVEEYREAGLAPTCSIGFIRDGTTCLNINECTSNPCHVHASCLDTEGSFICDCNSGFTGDGFSCMDINECRSDPCHVNALCTDTSGSYTCTCNDGYVGNGFTCEELQTSANNNAVIYIAIGVLLGVLFIASMAIIMILVIRFAPKKRNVTVKADKYQPPKC